MIRTAGLRTAPAIALLALGCASAPARTSGSGRDAPPAARGSAIVVQGEDIQGRGQTLLRLLDERVSGMSVTYNGPCPSIIIRGRKSIFGDNDPLIYVDGARALNTCVLDDLSTDVVKRIEVYPSGVAFKPGYDSSRNGLILVYVLNGTEG
jgi:hypothetical protein